MRQISMPQKDVFLLLDVRKKIAYLKKKYRTTNPFELADMIGIVVITEDLGAIDGYYNKQLRQKQIHINCNLSENDMLFTCAHELGHALLHQNSNTKFLYENTLLSVDKLEQEANKFAMELLLPDDLLLEYSNCSIEQMSRLFGYSEKLIELRLKLSVKL